MLTALLLAGAASFTFPISTGPVSAGNGPAMVVTMVTAGEVDPNGVIPTFDGVPGAGVINWDIAYPATVLYVGMNYELEALVNDNTYSGPCKGYIELTQEQSGKKVVLTKFVFYSRDDCGSGIGYGGTSEVTIPNSPGPATLSATMQYGGQKSVMSVPMVIQ
jgi:hypothetical protein